MPSTRVQQYARTEVRVPQRAAAPLWRALEQWWGVLNAVVRSSYFVTGSVTSTAEAPTGAMLLLCASQVCSAVVVLRWTVVLVYARGTYTFK